LINRSKISAADAMVQFDTWLNEWSAHDGHSSKKNTPKIYKKYASALLTSLDKSG